MQHLGQVAGHGDGGQAKPRPRDLAARLVFLQHRLSARDGHGETDPDTALRSVNRRINADHIAVRIEQGTATIAGIDGRVGLDHTFELAVLGVDGAIERTYDPGCQRAFKLERVADGEHLLADHQMIAIAQA